MSKIACPKCGAVDIYTRFTPKGRCWDVLPYRARCSTDEEHLHRTCRGCQYDWCDPTLDSAKATP